MDHESDIERAGRAKRGSPFLTTDQAAAYLKISAKSLKRLRRAGKGPPFRRHCRFVPYHIDALDSSSRASGAPEPGRWTGHRSPRPAPPRTPGAAEAAQSGGRGKRG